MVSFPVDSTDLRVWLPETVDLEPEHFERAREISERVTGEAEQWQTYLNALASLGFEEWLNDRMPDKILNRDPEVSEAVCHLMVGKFKFYLLATEHLLDEVVSLPADAINRPDLAAHFYVLLEVLDEQEQVLVRGFQRCDQLLDYLSRANLKPSRDGCYRLPLSEFDAEPNHLLFYCRFLEPAAIPLSATAEGQAMSSVTEAAENLLEYLEETRTKLSQWLQGVFEQSWQAIDALVSPEANLALRASNAESGAKRGKLINLGMQLGGETVALLVTVTEEAEEKLGVLVQLHPAGGKKYLPANLKLTLLSKAGKTLQEVTSRSQDNYIQLKSFKAKPATRFSLEVSLGDVSVREDFEL
jgi:hypothetical protein